MNLRAVHKIRKEYLKHKLDEYSIHPDPFVQFEVWFEEAFRIVRDDANAMALATVSSDGQPSMRMVLLKSFNEKGFVFFTNYLSRKGVELTENPRAALLFYWKEMERQVRITGVVKKIPRRESDEYFRSRPLESRISAVVSPQSAQIPDRAFLESKVEEIAKRKREVRIPTYWGGYLLSPIDFEFWQGRENRLHDRIKYVRKRNEWIVCRLAP